MRKLDVQNGTESEVKLRSAKAYAIIITAEDQKASTTSMHHGIVLSTMRSGVAAEGGSSAGPDPRTPVVAALAKNLAADA